MTLYNSLVLVYIYPFHRIVASLLSKLAAAWSKIQETIILSGLANLLNNRFGNSAEERRSLHDH
jgi:hypothetical protein